MYRLVRLLLCLQDFAVGRADAEGNDGRICGNQDFTRTVDGDLGICKGENRNRQNDQQGQEHGKYFTHLNALLRVVDGVILLPARRKNNEEDVNSEFLSIQIKMPRS